MQKLRKLKFAGADEGSVGNTTYTELRRALIELQLPDPFLSAVSWPGHQSYWSGNTFSLLHHSGVRSLPNLFERVTLHCQCGGVRMIVVVEREILSSLLII